MIIGLYSLESLLKGQINCFFTNAFKNYFDIDGYFFNNVQC